MGLHGSCLLLRLLTDVIPATVCSKSNRVDQQPLRLKRRVKLELESDHQHQQNNRVNDLTMVCSVHPC
jgi:hypothetical protein